MDLYKQYLGLQPAEMQMLMSIVNLPWTFKVCYGFFADNVPIRGSRRRIYIAITGALEAFFLLFIIPESINNKYMITMCLTLYATNVAFCDAIIDALMVS